MKIYLRLSFIGILLLAAGTPSAAAPSQSGNGGFSSQIGYSPTPATKLAFVDVKVECETGYTCGLTNVEVDWDDGSAIDSFVDYLPIDEAGFQHEYAENGLYHVEASADDDMGNWVLWTGLDVTVFY